MSAAELAALTIPTSASSLDTLAKLEVLADRGDTQAAWQRAHYLLDLFDAVRFAGDETSRSALATISGRPRSAMRGSAATAAIAELIVLEVDHVLELDREHSLAQQAHALIRFDASPPTERAQVFQRIEELKRVLANNSDLRSAARLRLFGYCKAALRDSQTLAGSQRRIALSHCLYPLYSSDPSPYFADRADARPPPPQQSEILADMARLLEHSPWQRLAFAVEEQQAWLEDFADGSVRPLPLDPVQLRLPPASHVSPYDDYPLLSADAVKTTDAKVALRRALGRDPRRVVALPYASETPAKTTLQAATVAAAAGANALAVLVSMQQRLSVPKGDYGSTRLQGNQVTRAGEMHWSLALLADAGKAPHKAEAKATAWDPRRAALRLHLEVSPKAWRLTSLQGEIKVFSSSTTETHPQDALRSELLAIRSAYPDEDGLVLVPTGETSHGALVAAANAARVDAGGKPLFAQLAIAAEVPKPRPGKALVQQILRRAAARVSVTPMTLDSRTPVALRCYQDLHNRRRAPVGEIRLELNAKGEIESSGRGATLVSCAKKAYGGAMLDGKISSVTVRFSAQAK